jgi:hypothetical protein
MSRGVQQCLPSCHPTHHHLLFLLSLLLFCFPLQYWITVNEPWCAAVLGHDSGGQHAPGRTVDPAREVYKVAHHMLIAHGRTYQMYQ